MKSSSHTRASLVTALIDKTWKEIYLCDDYVFFYHNSIPKHWWYSESDYFKDLAIELKRPGDNLQAGYVEVLKYWISMKNINLF